MNKTSKDFLVKNGYKAVSSEKIKNVLKPGELINFCIEISQKDSKKLLARIPEEKVILNYDYKNDSEILNISMTDDTHLKLFSAQIEDIHELYVKVGQTETEVVLSLNTDSNKYKFSFENRQ